MNEDLDMGGYRVLQVYGFVGGTDSGGDLNVISIVRKSVRVWYRFDEFWKSYVDERASGMSFGFSFSVRVLIRMWVWLSGVEDQNCPDTILII